MNAVLINRGLSRLHYESRQSALVCESSRNAVSFYERNPQVEPYRPAEFHAARVTEESRKEAEALRRMNAILLDAGLEAGQQVETDDGHLYRASNPGQMAAYLGRCLPHDVAYEDALASSSLDEILEDDSYDEKREWNSDYLRSVAIN